MGEHGKNRTKKCAYCNRIIEPGQGIQITWGIWVCSEEHADEWRADQAW